MANLDIKIREAELADLELIVDFIRKKASLMDVKICWQQQQINCSKRCFASLR
jgi:hypothetical protein